MHKPHPFKSIPGIFILGLLTGLVLLLIQKNMPVPAEEPKLDTATTTIRDSLADEKPQSGLQEVQLLLADKPFTVEVALTPEQEAKGLMYRTELPDGHGMLFSFRPARKVSFWMKNTKIPLDMVFLHQKRVVHLIKDVQPCLNDPCPSYPSVHPVDMAVELPAGSIQKTGIQFGDTALLGKAESGK